ncbi:hypothetical protein AAEX28_02370 [Lentisphaerota bacterium WC36G]|nr:hypothetical protein LJT99_05255 [Lentisphaerae bacterium WC36]
MNILELKTKLCDFFANKLNLEVDKTIFECPLDESVNDGLGLIINGMPSNNRPNISTLDLQLLGRYNTLDDALIISEKFKKFLPHYDTEFSILFATGVAVYPTSNKGKRVYAVSINLKIKCKKIKRINKLSYKN